MPYFRALLVLSFFWLNCCDRGFWKAKKIGPAINVVVVSSSQDLLEEHLIQKFAFQNGSQVHFQFVKTNDEAKQKLWKKEADVAMGRFNKSNEDQVLESEAYEDFSQQKVFWFSPYSGELRGDFHGWLHQSFRDGTIQQAQDLFKKPISKLSDLDKDWFNKRYKNRFKNFKSKILKFSKTYQVPWSLVAAVSYQESQWQQEARSPSGVRGFMQITKETADFLGLENPDKVEQNIHGGIRYLDMLIKEQPENLTNRERTVLALIAYNMGPAALKEAQKLAQSNGLNPYQWKDLKTLLPYPKSNETIQFVNRVLAYWDYINQNKI